MAKPHETLGVQPNASREEIRAAYQRLAAQHHPDRPGGGDIVQFQQVGHAYKVMMEKAAAVGLFDDIFTDFAKTFHNA